MRYILFNDELLLRTQTSPVQVRTMRSQELPIKIISPGRCFRNDSLDATHSPMFHQIEGLVVGKDITMAQFKGTLELFVKSYSEVIQEQNSDHITSHSQSQVQK